MGHTEPDFLAAAERSYQANLERLTVREGEIERKGREIVSKLSQLDLSDVCCSDALMAAVMTNDATLAGQVLMTLVNSYGIQVAEREYFGEAFTDGEAQAMQLVSNHVKANARRVA